MLERYYSRSELSTKEIKSRLSHYADFYHFMIEEIERYLGDLGISLKAVEVKVLLSREDDTSIYAIFFDSITDLNYYKLCSPYTPYNVKIRLVLKGDKET